MLKVNPLWRWLGVFVLLAAILLLPVAAEQSQMLESTLARTLGVFAATRALNGVISVAQHTALELTPAGVGVHLALGEILDPVNDLLERFSWILLMSSSVVGVQRLVLEAAASIPILVASVTILGLWAARTEMGPMRDTGGGRLLQRALLLLLLLRVLLPMSVLISGWIEQTYLAPKIDATQQSLESVHEEIQTLNRKAASAQQLEDEGWFASAQRKLSSLGDSLDWERRVDELMQASQLAAEKIIDAVGLFILQSLLLPLVTLWVSWRLLLTLLPQRP